MNIVVLLLVAFLHDQPATATTPAIPAHAETRAIVANTEAACNAAGQAIVSQLTQNPAVSHAGFACIPVNNPADKQA